MAVPSLASAEPVPVPRPASGLTRAAEWIATYGPAAVIFTLPLEFSAMYLRQPLARWILVVVAAAFAYLLATRRRTLEVPAERSAVVLAVFLATAVVGWLVTRPPGSLKEIGDVVLYPAIGLLLMNLVRDGVDHRRAWLALLASGLVVGLLGVGLGLTHHTIWTPNPVVANRLNITFADPNITARFLTVCATAAVMLFSARRVPSWLAVAAALACAISLPMTFSRSGLVLFAFSIILGAALSVDRRRAFAFAAVVLVVFVGYTAGNPETRQRTIDAGNTLLTAVTGTAQNISGGSPAGPAGDTFALEDNRRYLIGAGVRMFADHPVFGVGFGGYQHAIKTAYSGFIPANVPNPDTVSHTAFVTVAAEQGLVGLALLLVFLVMLGLEAWRARGNLWALVPATVIVPIVLYSQFEGRLIEEPYFWVFLALFYTAVARRALPWGRSHRI